MHFNLIDRYIPSFHLLMYKNEKEIAKAFSIHFRAWPLHLGTSLGSIEALNLKILRKQAEVFGLGPTITWSRAVELERQCHRQRDRRHFQSSVTLRRCRFPNHLHRHERQQRAQ